MKEEHIEVEGNIHTVLPGTMFRVELDNKHLVLATICGKMRKRFVRLTTGDRVKMEMSPYDLEQGPHHLATAVSIRFKHGAAPIRAS
jgi:translation initiation factor IF-1